MVLIFILIPDHFSDFALWSNIGQTAGGRLTKISSTGKTRFWKFFGQPFGKNIFPKTHPRKHPFGNIIQNMKYSWKQGYPKYNIIVEYLCSHIIIIYIYIIILYYIILYYIILYYIILYYIILYYIILYYISHVLFRYL